MYGARDIFDMEFRNWHLPTSLLTCTWKFVPSMLESLKSPFLLTAPHMENMYIHTPHGPP